MTMLLARPVARKIGRRPFADGLDVEAEAPIEAASPDPIPASVNRVRLVDGAHAGAYRAVACPRGRREWARVDDGRILTAWDAGRAYEAGRLAILGDGPISPAAPAPRPSDPRALDDTWNSGWCLGRMGLDADPCRDWADDLRASFLDGLTWGRQQLEADRESSYLDELAREAEERDDLSSEWRVRHAPDRI